MTEVKLQDAIDEAVLVRVKDVIGTNGVAVQVWYGGTQVRVFAPNWDCTGSWTEIGVWSLSDDKGRPVERAKVAEHMEMHFETMSEVPEVSES